MKSPARNTPSRLEHGYPGGGTKHMMKYMSPPEGAFLRFLGNRMLS